MGGLHTAESTLSCCKQQCQCTFVRICLVSLCTFVPTCRLVFPCRWSTTGGSSRCSLRPTTATRWATRAPSCASTGKTWCVRVVCGGKRRRVGLSWTGAVAAGVGYRCGRKDRPLTSHAPGTTDATRVRSPTCLQHGAPILPSPAPLQRASPSHHPSRPALALCLYTHPSPLCTAFTGMFLVSICMLASIR